MLEEVAGQQRGSGTQLGTGEVVTPSLSYRWFRVLYETSQLLSGILDRNGTVLDGNQLSIEGCGLVRDEVIGTPFWEGGWWRPDPDVADQVRRWCEHAVATGEPVRGVSRYFLGDGTPRLVDLSIVPVRDDDGDAVVYLVATGSDVTEAVSAQQEREQRLVLEAEAARRAAADTAAELAAAVELERRADERLQQLSTVALELAGARTVEDLSAIVFNEGLPILGADGGAVIVREGDELRLAVSEKLGPDVQVIYGRLPLDSPLAGPHTARTGQRNVLPDRATGLAFSPEMAEVYADTGRLAWVCEPLFVGGDLLGALIVSWVEERRFGDDELALIAAFAAQVAQALRRIQASDAEQDAAASVLRLSESLQRSLLTRPATPSTLEVAVRYLPAVETVHIGGDWYDAFTTVDGATVISVGDVFGHDDHSAALMAQLRNLLRGLAVDSDDSPAVLLTRLEHAMVQLGVETLATAIVARIDRRQDARRPGATTLRWSSAGHLPPVLRLPDGEIRILDGKADRLLGIGPTPDRVERITLLPHGATLVLYTDGLVERRTESIDAGVQRLADALATCPTGDPEDVCDRLLDHLLPSAPSDDIAIVAVRPRGRGPVPARQP